LVIDKISKILISRGCTKLSGHSVIIPEITKSDCKKIQKLSSTLQSQVRDDIKTQTVEQLEKYNNEAISYQLLYQQIKGKQL
jgi:hypothetical protein